MHSATALAALGGSLAPVLVLVLVLLLPVRRSAQVLMSVPFPAAERMMSKIMSTMKERPTAKPCNEVYTAMSVRERMSAPMKLFGEERRGEESQSAAKSRGDIVHMKMCTWEDGEVVGMKLPHAPQERKDAEHAHSDCEDDQYAFLLLCEILTCRGITCTL